MDRKTQITILLGVMVFVGMSAIVWILLLDIVAVVGSLATGDINTAFGEHVPKLGEDAGKFLVFSQYTIINGIDVLRENEDLAYMQRTSIHNQIIGSLALTFLLPLLMMSFVGFFIRDGETSLMSYLFILFVSFVIIGLVQAVVSFIVLGHVVWPYMGLVYFFNNIDVLIGSFGVIAPDNLMVIPT